jgi:hypothetical protein
MAFLAGWVVTQAWQGPHYSWLTDSISDMQAATAPHVWFPIACFASGGLGSFAFLVFGLRPSLAAADRLARWAPWAVAVAALVLGNSFPLIPCQLGPACSAVRQLRSAGGMTDALGAGLGLLVVALSPGPLWAGLAGVPAWHGFRPVAVVAKPVLIACYLLLCASSLTGADQGLAERILVTASTLWLGALAAAWLRRLPRPPARSAPTLPVETG